MDRIVTEDEDTGTATPAPAWLLEEIEAGLEDVRQGRTVPAEVVLNELKAKLEAWKARKGLTDSHGETFQRRSTAD